MGGGQIGETPIYLALSLLLRRATQTIQSQLSSRNLGAVGEVCNKDYSYSVIETSTAKVELLERGIICVRIAAGVTQGLPEAVENMEACIRAVAGERRPLLVDIRAARMLQPEAREYYGKKGLEEFTALAILIQSGVLGTIMGNIYMRVARHAVPVRLFMSERKALSWLRSFEIVSK